MQPIRIIYPKGRENVPRPLRAFFKECTCLQSPGYAPEGYIFVQILEVSFGIYVQYYWLITLLSGHLTP